VANVGGDSQKTSAQAAAVEEVRKRLDKKLRKFLQTRKDLSTSVAVLTEGRRLTIRLSASRFFDAAQAAIRPEMIPILDAIAVELGGLKRKVRVEGHTDDGPVGRGRFRDNWDLSASRAAAVTSYIERAHEIDGKFLAAAGYASMRPISVNKTAAGRESNRRVEMVVELEDGDSIAKLGK
jgi:chemotaxis protein MotB